MFKNINGFPIQVYYKDFLIFRSILQFFVYLPKFLHLLQNLGFPLKLKDFLLIYRLKIEILQILFLFWEFFPKINLKIIKNNNLH